MVRAGPPIRRSRVCNLHARREIQQRADHLRRAGAGTVRASLPADAVRSGRCSPGEFVEAGHHVVEATDEARLLGRSRLVRQFVQPLEVGQCVADAVLFLFHAAPFWQLSQRFAWVEERFGVSWQLNLP